MPDIPVALAVAGMIAALPGSVIGAPVSFVLIGVVGVGIGVESLEFAPLAVHPNPRDRGPLPIPSGSRVP